MARIYAGIVAPLAFVTSLARGAIHAWPTHKTLWIAWISLLVFAVFGALIGWIGQRIVDEEVRARVAAEPATQVPETSPPASAEASG